MAPVLQCPDCGEKHPLATVPTHGAFPCRACGRVLKVPETGARPTITPPTVAAPKVAPVTVTTAPPRPAAATVPTPAPVATAVARPPAEADPTATRVVPPVDGEALGALSPKSSRRPVARLGSVPWWLRFLLWVVAVPVSFLLVFVIARGLSVFTTNQLSDLFLANDNARFWPVARLLPFVALLTATFVQVGVYLLARLRGRSRGARPVGDLGGSTSPRRAR
jgi:hypothetical protein